MLTPADLEVNVLEFRLRSFQFQRLVELGGESYAVFGRTETENERQLRPSLVHLSVVVPLPWVVLDEATDLLRVAPSGKAGPVSAGNPVEIGAEPSEFDEDGAAWKRTVAGPAGYLYAPADRAGLLLSPEGRAALGG